MRQFLSAETRKFTKAPYQQKEARSHVLCVSYCHADPKCHSVNYNIDNHQCELNNATRAQYPDDFVFECGSVYFDADEETPLYSVPNKPLSTQPGSAGPKYSSCKELLQTCHKESGIYTVYPSALNNDSLQVYCDMDGEGWMVIQRRQDGSVDFLRNWVDYQVGFGNMSGEFWLGNDNLRALTEFTGLWKLKIEMVDSDGNEVFAEYGHFKISGEYFKLQVGLYNAINSTGLDALSWHNGKMFTTKDKDNNAQTETGQITGGWWYWRGYDANLHGMYHQNTTAQSNGIHWLSSVSPYEYFTVKACTMKISQITSINEQV
ncbi:ficolin-3-like [Asterias rubens]|uniref:ficolin-3-like n=1 Tax=Asterias rubens TaxID=7604 RepID=UPI001454F84B|nr:ficolin-3-like [Asterias rubens]